MRSGAAATPGSGHTEGSGTNIEVRFLNLPVQSLAEVREDSGTEPRSGSEGFRCRVLVRFWRIPLQIFGEVVDGSGADILGQVPEGSGAEGSGADIEVRFQKVPVQILR